MSSLLEKFVSQVDFESYPDFKDNFRIKTPENFNFAYDVVDEYARLYPEKVALVWCNDDTEKIFTFSDMKEYSDRAANFFAQQGVKKGDRVMLTLKSRYHFWFCILALHKLGAITIPATHMLKARDIVYRIKKCRYQNGGVHRRGRSTGMF
nr:AMP-binding protein [Methanobacterium formicicum]